MGYYERFPCKIEACSLCYVVKGSLKATINLTEFDVTAGDFVVLLPGGFLHISDMSDDLLISFEGYSSAFLKTVNFWKLISPIMQFVIKQPVLSLDERMGTFYRESFSIMTKASSFGQSFMTHSIAQSALVVAIDMLSNAITHNLVKGTSVKNSSRDQAIVGEFMQLALENYRTEHKISFYAHEASLTLSHFCNVISKTTGMTAQQIIMNLIIMDAKTQLKGSDAAVADIAYSLGFSTPTTFNRYFKTYTGMTPQEYRNNDNN
jgi:AraC-like DNA-binding protein